MNTKRYYCYILECSDKTLYTGYTTDPERRLAAHNNGKGAKYTRFRLPCRLVYCEEFLDKSSALRREYEIKHKYSRKQKLNLIKAKENDVCNLLKNPINKAINIDEQKENNRK